MEEILVDTLGALKAQGMGLFAHCTALNSGHGAPLNLDLLIERFGEDYVFIDEVRIAAATTCSRCGHRGAKLTVISNTKHIGSSNPYLKAKGE